MLTEQERASPSDKVLATAAELGVFLSGAPDTLCRASLLIEELESLSALNNDTEFD